MADLGPESQVFPSPIPSPLLKTSETLLSPTLSGLPWPVQTLWCLASRHLQGVRITLASTVSSQNFSKLVLGTKFPLASESGHVIVMSPRAETVLTPPPIARGGGGLGMK